MIVEFNFRYNGMKVFHASPIKFTEFDFDNNQIHVGDFLAALTVAERKNCTYLYRCELNITLKDIYESEDVGNYEKWKEVIADAKKAGKKVISYHNKYENSLEPSYLVIDPSVLTIQKIQSITPDYIDAELGKFFNDFHI